MTRFIGMAHLLLPAAGGAAALLARVLHGSARPYLATTLVIIGGVMLGWAAALMLESMAHLVGHLEVDVDDDDVEAKIEAALAAREEDSDG